MAPTVPAITFAIPYYDKLTYLREAIASVQAQTSPDWNLLIVDDAGPEPPDELIAELDDPRITLVRNETNLGLAGNWNTCLRLATGSWVTLLHADDRLAVDYAARVMEVATSRPELAAIFTDATVIDSTGQPTRSLPETVKGFARRPAHDHDVAGDEGLASVLFNNYVMCPTLCYRAALVRDLPFDARWRMVLDLDHTAHLLLAGHTLHGIRTPLYAYRRHDANQTTALTASAIRFEEELMLYRELATMAAAAGWKRTARVARRRVMVRGHLALQAVLDIGHRQFAAARRKAGLLIADLHGETTS